MGKDGDWEGYRAQKEERVEEKNGIFVLAANDSGSILPERPNLQSLRPKGLVQNVVPQHSRVPRKCGCTSTSAP